LQAKQLEYEYIREILLRRRTDQQVVQYGIVRLNFEFLGDEIQSEIEGQQVPLGRILIRHNVMRRVQLLSLYRVQSGPALAAGLGTGQGETCFGRTALIHCNDQPAIELLEIVKVQ
jgi:chorismate-pyruvate lyase